MLSVLLTLSVLSPTPHDERLRLELPPEPIRVVVSPSPRLELPSLGKLPARFVPALRQWFLLCNLTQDPDSDPCRVFMTLERSALELLNRKHRGKK